MEPVRPGRGSNTAMQPLYMKPCPSVTTPDGVPSEWVSDTTLPRASMQEMCVVSVASAPSRGTVKRSPARMADAISAA